MDNLKAQLALECLKIARSIYSVDEETIIIETAQKLLDFITRNS